MKTQRQQLPLLNFAGGLNTAANPAAMKQPDAVEAFNINLLLSGGIERRRGVEFIGKNTDGELYYTEPSDDYIVDGTVAYPAPSFSIMTVLNSDNELGTVAIVHINQSILIYDFDLLTDLAQGTTPRQVLDISSYTVEGCAFFKTTFSFDRGKMFLANRYINPGYIYLKSDDTFDFSPLTITTRDLDGNPDRDSMVNHNEKTYICITAHTGSSDKEPGVGTSWTLYWTLFGPETSIPEIEDPDNDGEYIPDPDFQVQPWASGTGYTTNIVGIAGNVSTCVFAGGRLWATGYLDAPNTIYFSQTATDDFKYGRMYQLADPLSQVDSEPVDTDGGTIIINGAETIYSLSEFKSGVLVIASNGLWYVAGSDVGGAFTPTSFSSEKVHSDGCVGPHAFTIVEDKFIYFGSGGIYSVTKDSLLGTLKPEDISIKIEDFYTSLANQDRYASYATYNAASRKLFYYCNFEAYDWEPSRNPYGQPTGFKDVLVFDTGLNAWCKHSLAEDEYGTQPFLTHTLPYPSRKLRYADVTDSSGTPLTLVDEVTKVQAQDNTRGHEDVWYDLCIVGRVTDDNVNIAFGDYSGDNFIDFELDEGFSSTYESEFQSAYLQMQTLSDRQTPEAFLIFERTESGIYDEDDDDITASGCYFQTTFNWDRDLGKKRQVYTPYKYTQLGYDGELPTKRLVRKKIRIRGSGNTMQFALTNDENKDFRFYGLQLGVELVREDP